MAIDGMKADLHRYLQVAREVLLWKLDGLSEYDVRRPMTPTGTNLLGVVKHVASVEAGYLGEVFGRPFPDDLPWFAEDAAPNADLWATPDETREQIVGMYRRVWANSDATIDACALDDRGSVPWWPEDRREPTLHFVLTHITCETMRHAGQLDIVRELIDGATGVRADNSNVWSQDEPDYWATHVARVEAAARAAASIETSGQA